jgi:hypothetical protein
LVLSVVLSFADTGARLIRLIDQGYGVPPSSLLHMSTRRASSMCSFSKVLDGLYEKQSDATEDRKECSDLHRDGPKAAGCRMCRGKTERRKEDR